MSEWPPDQERSKETTRPEVRWDRKLRQVVSRSDERPPGVAHSILTKPRALARRVHDAVVRRLKPLVRGPLDRVRTFLLAPISARLDSTQQSLLAQQKYVAELADQSNEIAARLSELQKIVGFLHVKADEAAIKARPVLRFSGAYALALADGYVFLPDSEEALISMYAAAGSEGLEPGTRRVMKLLVGPGDHVIDVGASVGLHTLAMANAVGPTGWVDAFEAEPRLGPYLERTKHVNGLANVRLHMFAVGKESGEAIFNVSRTIGHSSLYSLEDRSGVREQVTVQVNTLDRLFPAEARIDLIKMDVEGAELDVLAGAQRVLRQSPDCAVIAECGPSHLHRTGVPIEKWIDAFSAFGFEAYSISEPEGMLRIASPQAIATQESVNVLFMRPGSKGHERLATGEGSRVRP